MLVEVLEQLWGLPESMLEDRVEVPEQVWEYQNRFGGYKQQTGREDRGGSTN